MITDKFIISDYKEFCDHAKVGDGSPNEILPVGTGRRTLAQRIYGARFGLASGQDEGATDVVATEVVDVVWQFPLHVTGDLAGASVGMGCAVSSVDTAGTSG